MVYWFGGAAAVLSDSEPSNRSTAALSHILRI
jgi:hypothetical protein